MTIPRFSAIALLAALVSACATPPPGGDPAAQRFRDSQLAAAQAAGERGDLALAASLLRTLITLDPQDPETREALRSVEAQIQQRASAARRRGLAAYAAENDRSGNAWMLEVLALLPGDEVAVRELRASVARASHARQGEKVATEFEALAMATRRLQTQDELARIRTAMAAQDYASALALGAEAREPDDPQLQELLRQAHLALADRAQRTGARREEFAHLEAARSAGDIDDEALEERIGILRRQLSSDAYREGLALINTDLDGAITVLEEATRYDPENVAAREKLDQARTLKRNLERIRGG